MSIVSYAQNFEDVILWRALGHVEDGVYIDIGANDPVVDSVSLAFYEKGWRGIHVEPVPAYARSISKARPDEKVEQVAVGLKVGKITFYEIEHTGLSTTDPDIAEKHRERGFDVFEREIECVPLDRIFEKYHYQDIHWLKIDVEGGERDVLESWRLSKARPWVVVVESTIPLSQEESYQGWESALLGKGYSFVYFDGLNRFYLHEAHPELKRHFKVPPNVFDRFVLSGRASNSMCALFLNEGKSLEESGGLADLLKDEVKELKRSIEHLEIENVRAQSRATQAEAIAMELSQQMESVFSSRSWRITSPMRWSAHQLSLLHRLGPKSRIEALVRKLIVGFIRYSESHPRVRRSLIFLVAFLGAKKRLKTTYQIYFNNDIMAYKRGNPNVPVEAGQLGPRALQTYQDMKQATDRQGGSE